MCGDGGTSYHQHLVKVLFKLVNVGVCLQALGVGHHAAEHELVILFHEEAASEHLLTLTHQLQIKCNQLNHKAAQWENLRRSQFLVCVQLACLMLSREGSPAGRCSRRSLRHSWITLRRTRHRTRKAGRKDGRSMSTKSSHETSSAPRSGLAA